MVSCQSSHSMTSCPQQIAVPFAVCIFGGFGEMPWRPSPPKIQGCRIDQQIQRWLKDQLQDSIANKGMAWPSRHATSKLDDSPQHRNISSNTKQFNVQSVWCSTKLFDLTLHHLCLRCTIRHYAEPFHATLHCLYVRCTIRHYAEPFHTTLHRLCVRCATRHYPEPFDTTLHRLCSVLQWSANRIRLSLGLFLWTLKTSKWTTR